MQSRKRMAQSLMIDILVKEENFQLAEKKFEEYETTFNDSTDHYSFYNKYGYFLLNQKKYDKAIVMFKRQIALAPNEANPYDSLGDGYRAAGNISEAIAKYKKAFEIDPEMKVSEKKLKELQKK
jgi:tetratricopeptide (TPR) repeat protein